VKGGIWPTQKFRRGAPYEFIIIIIIILFLFFFILFFIIIIIKVVCT